jgi:hypothetical protein
MNARIRAALAASALLAALPACESRGGIGGMATGIPASAGASTAAGDPGAAARTAAAAAPGTAAWTGAPDAPPSAAECAWLYARYRTWAPELLAEELGFLARCRGSDRGVLACIDAAKKECPAGTGASAEGLDDVCMTDRGGDCVQRHRTLAARKEGVPERIARAILDGAITPDAAGVLALSGDWATLAKLEKAYAVALPGRRELLFIPVWRGRCRNVRGYVWSSKPFEPGDFAKGADGHETLPALQPRLADPCGPPPDLRPPGPPPPVTEPFVVEEKLDPQWIAVGWTWD